MKKLNQDSFDVVLKGLRHTNGRCYGTSFTYGTNVYTKHVLTAVIQVSILEERLPAYNNYVYINYEPVPISEKYYVGADYTLIW